MNTLIIIPLLSLFLQSSEYQFVDTASFTLLPGIKLNLKASAFDSTQHSIEHCVVGPISDPWQGVCLIDGKQVFGTDWDIPRTQLEEAYIETSGKKIMLDVSSMYNPWIASAEKRFFSAHTIEGGVTIIAEFSDGAGSYQAEWRVVAGTSVRVKLEKDNR